MPSKQTARAFGDDPKTVEPAAKLAPAESQEFLRDQVTAPEPTTSYLLGSTLEGTGDLSASRADAFLVDGKTVSSKLGTNTLQNSAQISSGDLGSGRGDEFTVAGKTVSSKLGTNTLQNSAQISSGDLGSGRGDEFTVAGKTVSSKLGTNTLQNSAQISSGDLGSGRDDKFVVDGKVVSSKLGTNTLQNSAQISSGDLGSGRDEAFAIENPDIQLGGASLESQIPGLAPEAGQNVSVSLPLAPELAAAKIDAGESVSPELMQEATKAVEKATLIHPEDIPAGLLAALPENTILRFAFSPEDMGALDLQAEHEAVAKVADVLTLNNPTEETMKYVLSTGQFEDVIWSGHGATDGLWITDLDGKAKKLAADDVAALMKDTGVQEVLLNVCNGGGEVDNALAGVGINSFAYDRSIIDAEAVADATNFAASGSLWDIDQRSRKEQWLDPTGGQVMTARRLEREQRFDQLTSQVGSWVTDKDHRKEDRKGSSPSGGPDLASALSGLGGKSLVKKLGDLLRGQTTKTGKIGKKSSKRTRF